MAERFIAGSKVDEVLHSVAKLRRKGLAFTLDLLGEAVVSEPEADAYQQQYLDLITGLAPFVARWTGIPAARPRRSDVDPARATSRSSCRPCTASSSRSTRTGSAEGVKERLRPILRAAREHDAHVHVDMEHYAYKDLTLDIFQQVFMEDEFRDWPDCGIVIQAYLPEAERDLQDLLEWVKQARDVRSASGSSRGPTGITRRSSSGYRGLALSRLSPRSGSRTTTSNGRHGS